MVTKYKKQQQQQNKQTNKQNKTKQDTVYKSLPTCQALLSNTCTCSIQNQYQLQIKSFDFYFGILV